MQMTHILHGDLSGIQDFIFNVRSEGAAKTLKGRSYFVQALSELCEHWLKTELGDGCRSFYNGGGNFYLFCREAGPDELNRWRREIQRELARHEIYINLSIAPKSADFSTTWKAIHGASNRDKLQKFALFPEALDEEKRFDGGDAWKHFTTNFVKNHRDGSYRIEQPRGRAPVESDGFSAFDFKLQLDSTRGEFENKIVSKLPLWKTPLLQKHEKWVETANERSQKAALRKGEPHKNLEADDIIEFEALGEFARVRTGTDKLAVLKMDVDGLGDFFRKNVKNEEEAGGVSRAMKHFFEEKMLTLWSGTFPYLDADKKPQTARFDENVYIVFSGGDDCIMIGAWDAIFQFAGVVHSAFTNFTKDPAQKLPAEFRPSISAGLILVDSKFPVVRMAKLADEALDKAKRETGKNSVCIFDRVLKWSEFESAKKIAGNLEHLIRVHEEPRGILQRVQMSHLGFERLQQNVQNGNLAHSQVWRLLYYLRYVKNPESLEKLKGIMDEYQNALLLVAINGARVNPDQFPVAARWAEFLTRI